MKTPEILQIFTLVMMLGVATPAAADRLIDRERGFSLLESDAAAGMELTSSEIPQVVVHLRSSSSNFPAFVVTEHPGAKALSRNTFRSVAEQIRSEYHQIGFLDAEILHAVPSMQQGQQILTVELRYRRDGVPFISSVTVVPTEGKHFLLTYTQPESEFAPAKRDGLVTSFRVERRAPPTAVKAARSRFLMVFYFVLGAAALIAIVLYQHRRSADAGTPPSR